MRLHNMLIMGFLLSCPPLYAQAGVLLPEDSSSTTETRPNLGLLPRATTKTDTTTTPKTNESTATAPATTSATDSSTAGMDSVNATAVQSIDINLLRKSMPEAFNNLSDDDIKKIIESQNEIDRNEIAKKYIKTDSSGKAYVDFNKLKKDMQEGPASSTQTLAPGGRVARTKASIARDQQTAELLAQGRISGNAVPTDEPARPDFLSGPPMILKRYDIKKYTSGSLSGSIDVAIPKDYIWGSDDAEKISLALGYKTEEIPSNCQLRLDTIVETDDGNTLYAASIMGGTADSVGYNGLMQAIRVRPLAVCNKPQGELPHTSSILFDANGFYAILLSKASCPVTSTGDRPPRSVVIQYLGDSKINCTFVK